VTEKPKKPPYILRIIGLIAIIWIGLLARDAIALKLDYDALQGDAASLSKASTKFDLAAVHTHVASLHSNLEALRSHTAPLMIFAPLLSSVPKFGGDIQAAPTLLNMAVELTAAADQGLGLLAPIWPLKTDGTQSAIEQVTQAIGEHRLDLQAIQHHIDRADTYRSAIDATRLSDRVKKLIDLFDQWYPATRSGTALISIMPQLIGMDRPRTYLLLVQNEDELRPTGGFISVAGRIIVSAGQIISLTMIDGGLVDDYLHKPYDFPPEPLYTVMGAELWLFRDANWSPDFPTSAQQSAHLYDYGKGGGPFDGIIAINQHVAEAVVAAVEPVSIENEEPLTAHTLQAALREAWGPRNYTKFSQRKDFINKMMQAIIQRMLQSPNEVRWPVLLRGLIDNLNSHDLLISLNLPDVDQAALARWSGALQKTSGDYLMVVDTNVGFNKTNSIVTQAMTYHAALQPDRSIRATVVIDYRNPNPAAPGCDHLMVSYLITTTYQTLIDRCYYDYLRVLTPDGAQLIDSTAQPVPAEYLVTGRGTDGSITVTRELDKNSFGTLLVVERGATRQIALSYSLPNTLLTRDGDNWVYHLIWQKQAGAYAWPIEFKLSWPGNWKYVTSAITPKTLEAHSLTIEQTLGADLEIEIKLSDKP
jgi:hypothetical protein